MAVLRLLREEGIGVDVASVGELAFARAAGFRGDEIVVHGNNKGEAFLRDAAAEGATVVLDSPDEAVLAAAAGVGRVLVRVTLGVDADTHEAIRTGHHGSKFGLPPVQARALDRGCARTGARRARAPRARRVAARGLRRPGGDDRPARVVRSLVPRQRSAGRRGSPTSAAGSGSVTTSTTAPRKRPSWPRAPSRRHGRRSPRQGSRRPRCGWSRAAHWSAPRVSPCTASAQSRGCPSAPGSRSTAACRTTHGPSSTTPSTRHSPPIAPPNRQTSASASPGCTASRATC